MKRSLVFPGLLIAIFFADCSSKKQPVFKNAFVDTLKGFKKDIPINKYGQYVSFYREDKEMQKLLGLDSLEDGFNALQIRVWYNLFGKERRMVEITNKDSVWSAAVYIFRGRTENGTTAIASKEINQVTPASGWAYFSKRLLDLKILTLPHSFDIDGYAMASPFDGDIYSVELATKNQYRFYDYGNPAMLDRSFWQAKNMVDILQLFKDELNVKQGN